jgi:hypothetical protein
MNSERSSTTDVLARLAFQGGDACMMPDGATRFPDHMMC